MNELPKKIHMIGIGGIGMSALAQLLLDHGCEITGSDMEESPTSQLLERTGIAVRLGGQRAENIPAGTELVIHTDAAHPDNAERAAAKARNIPELSYFQVLGKVSAGKKTIAIAGTHGKTTTTGMTAKILADAGASPTAIVGSIVQDFGSNYLRGDSDLFVVEADEYRAHLLELSPWLLVINNLEWDHTDFYPTFEAMQETFKKAALKVPSDGYIVTNPRHPNIAPVLEGVSATIVDYTQESEYALRLPGGFNASNARAAAAAAHAAFPAVTQDSIATSLAHFHGTWRRFEYRGKTALGADVYDDYAHHPTAVRETIRALREKTPGKIIIAFHPHLYSRTRDLLDEFATAFIGADRVLIAPIYPAREVDDGSISSEMLAERMRTAGTTAAAYPSFAAIEKELASVPAGDVIMTMGAGDIYKVADALVTRA